MVTDPALRLVFVHGFTQTAASWTPILRRLPLRWDVCAVDAPGHGSAATVDVDLWGAADHVVAHGGGGVYVGYSMGARIALHAALARPEHVHGLVLISGTAGIDQPHERAERRRRDAALAASIERDGVDVFLQRWLAQPMFATVPADRAGVAARRHNTTAGLASSLRSAGTGAQEPLWDRLAELSVPTLVVAGQLDHRFVALAKRLHAGITGARLSIVPDAGHAVALERPDELAAALSSFVTATFNASRG
ncbi:MAG: alpha/beta fold hydrolase [Desertimonas sp.]